MASSTLSSDLSRVFRGCLEDLPPLDSNVIRIFLSSTFTDYSEERNLLMREAFPELRRYCEKKGLDFQVADMRWGVRDDAQIDHKTTEICIQEIANCQKISHGPCFVSLLGNKYGYRPFPTEIEVEEFQTLKKAACTVAKDVTLLTDWFVRDDNSVPPTYVLQPITTKFPYYNDDSEENEEKHQQDIEDWAAVSDLLAVTFRASAACALKYGHMSAQQKHKYFMSVTEAEVDQGILSFPDAGTRTISFQRTLTGIDSADSLAKRYQDLEGGQFDNEASDLLNDLKEVKLPRSVQRDDISTYTLDWTSNGIDPEVTAHAQYLQEMSQTFVSKMRRQIDASLERTVAVGTQKELYQEVVHHSQFCTRKCRHFCGRVEVLSQIKSQALRLYDVAKKLDELGERLEMEPEEAKEAVKEIIQDMKEELEGNDTESEDELKQQKAAVESMGVTFAVEEEDLSPAKAHSKELAVGNLLSKGQLTKPVVVYGPSGCGKTSLMAWIARTCHTWLQKEPVKIMRFLGTSPQSSSIRGVLYSICEQIWEAYNVQRPDFDIQKDFTFLTLYLQALLVKINTEEQPLVLILDSVDQLNEEDYAHGMDWLPRVLPPNVYLILSMVPQTHSCLDNTRMLLTEDDCFIEVPALPRDTACEILSNWYSAIGRTLTNEQQDYILGALRRCPQPMFLKLAFEQASQWRSYTPKEEWAVGHGVKAAVEQLFNNLEKDHGRILVSRALGYLTAAKHGLSNSEMEDLLSCDDAVLQDTYLHHLPASETLIRLPPLLWRRIHYDLREYLVQRQAGGKDVITWYHRQFLETAQDRYAPPNTKTKLHSALADYFMGRWSDQVKPLELYKRKKGLYPQAMRGVPAQPILYCPTVYNLRKLDELPYQLIGSGRYMEMLTEVCQNLEWLFYKSKANGVSAALNDIKQALRHIKMKLQKKEPEKVAPSDEVQEVENAVDAPGSDSMNQELVADVDQEIERKVNGEVNDAYLTDLAEGSMVEEERQQQLQEEEEAVDETVLKVIEEDMSLIYDLLMLACDAVRKDVNNLPIQILGQLGKVEEVTASLQRLRDAAQQWVTETNKPLLVPHARCLPMPGKDLMTSIDLAIYYPGDAYEFEKKLCLSKDYKVLYGIERTQDGDNLRQFDLENSAATMRLTQLHKSIKWIDLLAADRYLSLQVYTQRDKFSPKYQPLIIDQLKQVPVVFPNFADPLCFSETGRYCILATKKEFSLKRDPFLDTKKVEKVDSEEEDSGVSAGDDEGDAVEKKPVEEKKEKEKDKDPMLELGTLYDLQTQTSKPLKVASKIKTMCGMQHAIFSPDEKHVVLSCEDGAQYVFSVAKAKWCGTSREEQSFIIGLQDERHVLTRAIHILPNGYLLSRGLSYQTEKILYLRDLNNNMATVAELQGHCYGVRFIVLNDAKTMAASATGETTIVNGVNTKYVYVWDLERKAKHSVCKGRGPYSCISFGGAHDEYVLSCGYRDSNVVMWYVGSRDAPCEEGLPIYNIIGHSKEVVYIQMCANNLLITAGLDNTVKCWSFDCIVDKCRQRLSSATDLEILREDLCKSPDRPYEPGEGRIVSTATAVSKNGQVAAVGTIDGWIIFYDLTDMTRIRYEKASEKEVTRILTTKSGKYFVSAADNIKVWDPKTGECVEELEGGMSQAAQCLAESRDILVAGYGGMECYGYLWDLTTGKKLQVLQGLYGFGQVVISSDASKVVTTFFDFPMVFDVGSGEATSENMQQADTMMYSCSCLRLSPDDRLVVACSVDGSVRVSDINSGGYKFRMQHRSSVREATFTQDSQLLVTAGFKNILVWSMSNGSLQQTLCRHQDFICRLSFVLGDRYLVSCANDKQIVVWDFKNHVSVASYHAHCPLVDISVADDLSSVLYSPENVAYLGVLKPNGSLAKIIEGEEKEDVPDVLVQAQAFAFAFSPQKAKQTTSRSCTIL